MFIVTDGDEGDREGLDLKYLEGVASRKVCELGPWGTSNDMKRHMQTQRGRGKEP